MTDAATETLLPTVDAPAFLVGITGYMDLAEADTVALKTRVRRMFRFLKHGPRHTDQDAEGEEKTLLETLVDDLVLLGPFPSPAGRRDHERRRETYRKALADWPGLPHTPIVVLTALAPGADTLVAEVVLEHEFRTNEFTIRAPLPFPHDLYRDASTFVHHPTNQPRQDDLDRQACYDRLIAMIGEAHTFAVRLDEDRDRTPKELHDVFTKDRDDQDRRHLRYYAAGETLANYCHLLLAIWNGEVEPSSCGTSRVAEARLSGPQPDLLTTSQGLPLPHGGPLLHILAERSSATQPDDAAATTVKTRSDQLPPLRLLHPYAFAHQRTDHTRIVGAGQHLDEILQHERLAMFCRVTHNLEEFNAAHRADTVAATKEFQNRLTYRDPENQERPFHTELASRSNDFATALEGIARFRVQASTANRPLDKAAKRTLLWLFLLTFVGASLLHVFAHWHGRTPVSEGEPAKTEQITGHESGAAQDHETPAHPDKNEHAGFGVREVCGGIALLLAVGTLGYFGIQQAKRYDERGHDYRALAEGLRVQFYWNLAGLGRSVSANYMQRQRSELDWIRGAIRSVSFPYDKWFDWFAALPQASQVKALRCVLHGWIRDQLAYFEKTYRSYRHTLHTCHKFGGTLALAGVFNFLVWWGCSVSPGIIDWIGARWSCIHWSSVAALAVAAVCGCVQLWRESCKSEPRAKKPWPRKFWQTVRHIGQLALDILVPCPDTHNQSPRPYRRRLGRLALAFLAHLPLALALAAVVLRVCVVLAGKYESLPEAANLGIILGGILLLGGALAVAWSEKNLYSELAYQYHTMASLFRHAKLRMEGDLATLEDQAGEPAEFAKTMREVQDFLHALGKEALDENAEWLLLHRARPLEPVMAG